MNYKNNIKIKIKKIVMSIYILTFLAILITGCHQEPVYIETRDNKPVTNDEILHVDVTDEEADLSAIYLLSEENEFASSFISKYDVGIHSKGYKVKLKIEYLNNIKVIDYLEMPSSKTVNNLYITMDNYDFIVALFNESELISKGVFDISTLNQEDKGFVCKAGNSTKSNAIGFSEKLDNNLIIYNTSLSVVHGDEEWNKDNEEKITLSVFLEDE